MNKNELKRLALELRAEIDLGSHTPFDPYRLADLYGIAVYRLGDLGCSSELLAHFQMIRGEVFSAALVPLPPGGAVIIENEAHSVERRRSTASHEMAYLTLGAYVRRAPA